MNNINERLDSAIELIKASRLNNWDNNTILFLVSGGSGNNNVQSELIYNLIKQELI